MGQPESVAEVIRVTRKDTLLIRVHVPQIQSKVAHHMRLCGVTCNDKAQNHIVDWVELHADAGRLRLLDHGWMRDEFGRLLGDLQDISTGEVLTDYLLEVGAAAERPNHYMDTLMKLMHAKEPDDAGG